jgi:hypothetical protein
MLQNEILFRNGFAVPFFLPLLSGVIFTLNTLN